MNSEKQPLGFAPVDLTDGREQLDWRSRYPDKSARWNIRFEAWYLAAHLFGVPLLLLWFGSGAPRAKLEIDEAAYQAFLPYAFAWLGGTFGGTLFAMKWLYHAVAKGMWNQDRRLWRIFTPHLSAGLSLVFILGVSSGLLGIFDQDAISAKESVLAIAFLVGYFSDNAVAKLTEVAETLFGTSRSTKASTSR